jgi:hypothetical protein
MLRPTLARNLRNNSTDITKTVLNSQAFSELATRFLLEGYDLLVR